MAWRNLLKHKGFSLINIGGLAVGLACCLLLTLYVYYEWSFDRQFEKKDRLYFSGLNLKINEGLVTTWATPNLLAQKVTESLPGVVASSRISLPVDGRLYTHEQNKFKLRSVFVDPSFLGMMNYQFVEGGPETSLAHPEQVILTAQTAKKLFGESPALGKTIRWDNSRDLRVGAVIADLPRNQSIQFEVLQPWAFSDLLDPAQKEKGWGNINCATLIELKDPAHLDATNAALKDLIVRQLPELKPYLYELFLHPLTKYHLYDRFEKGKSAGGKIDQIRLFLLLAGAVLVIACINYMNLSTARSEKRAKEVGIRKTMGSTRQNLVLQFLLESWMLATLAMLLAFALLELMLPTFNQWLRLTIRIPYEMPLFWTSLIGLVFLTGLLAGSYPSFYLSSFIPVKVLKGFKGNSGNLSLRKVLVVFQFTLSIGMMVAAVVIYKQIQYLKNQPLGFDQHYLVEMDIEGELKNPNKLAHFQQQLIQKDLILSATPYPNSFTGGGSVTSSFSWPGKPADENALIEERGVGYHLSTTLGAKMVQGRDFSPLYPSDTSQAVILNESAVKRMNLKDPVGQIIHYSGRPYHIIGVMNDQLNEALGKTARPTVFYYDVEQSSVLLLKLTNQSSLTHTLTSLKAESENINPAYPSKVNFISENMQAKLENERLLGLLSNAFAMFALLISCLGLLGLSFYLAEQRKKEISIRKVLGASPKDILYLLNKDFIRLVILSNFIAIPLTYLLLSRWLTNYDQRMDLNGWPFLAGFIGSLLIALLTVSIQTVKAARATVMTALKYE